MICTLANSLWLLGTITELRRFRRGVRRVRQEQEQVLARILAHNAQTEYGRLFSFSSCASVSEYQRRVPLRDYDNYRKWIDRIAAGERDVLTREKVKLFEPTSGSAGATKLIPYTSSLQREFQKGIRAWIADLFLHSPDLLRGKAYWSASPVGTRSLRTPGGIPVGFDDDSAYVGGWQQLMVRTVMAAPSELRFVQEIEVFRYRTLLSLIRAHDLRLISVWNPTFLTLILDRLAEWGDSLVHDLRIAGDARAARNLQWALRAATAQERYSRLWPRLGLISCWGDANAAGPAAQLAHLLPHVRMQPKGLIATEGFISIPMQAHEGAALAVRSHFLEFLPVDSSGVADDRRPMLAHRLDRGSKYSIALTTGGGLYRYQLGDVVEVTGHFQECPLVRFRERLGEVSDWFGEKLSEAHASQVLRDTFRELGVVTAFAMLACETEPHPGYVLYIDTPERCELLLQAAELIDRGLCSNFHYSYARRLGQLGSVRVFRAPGIANAYLQAAVRNGQRSGNVKPRVLERHNGWWRIFEGRFVTGESSAGWMERPVLSAWNTTCLRPFAAENKPAGQKVS